MALLTTLQLQQLEMIGYWLLTTLQQLVKIRNRLLTNVLSAVKFSLIMHGFVEKRNVSTITNISTHFTGLKIRI